MDTTKIKATEIKATPKFSACGIDKKCVLKKEGHKPDTTKLAPLKEMKDSTQQIEKKEPKIKVLDEEPILKSQYPDIPPIDIKALFESGQFKVITLPPNL